MEQVSLLLVHRDAGASAAATEILSRAGFDVQATPDAARARESAADVLVVDPALPDAASVMDAAKHRDQVVVPWDAAVVGTNFDSGPRRLLAAVNRACAKQRARKAERRRSRHLAGSVDLIADIALAVTSTLDLRTLLRSSAEEAKRLLRAETAAVLLVDEAKGELWFDAASEGSEALASTRLRMDQGVCGWVATHQEAATCDDPSKDPRFWKGVDARTGLITRAVVAVPLINAGSVVGVIEVVNPTDRAHFDAEDVDVLMALAPFLAVAIQNARIAGDLRASREIAMASNEHLEAKVQERTRQLQFAKKELESTFDAIAEPIAIVEDFKVRRANLAFAAMAKVDIRSVPNRSCFEVLAGRTSPCENCPIARKDRSPSDVALGDRIFRVSGFAVGGTEAQVAHYRDVTEERALAAKLKESERLAAVGQLAAGAAHEINNPMGFITSNLQTLKEVMSGAAVAIRRLSLAADLAKAGDSRKAAEMVIKVRDELESRNLHEDIGEGDQIVDESLMGAARVSDIVRALKQLTSQETTQAEVLDVSTCLDRAAERAVAAQGGSIEWVRRESAEVKAQPIRLEQALFQVLRNALQASPGKPVQLSTVVNRDHVIVSVRDRGTGMPEDVRSRAFEPFFTTRGVGGGVGLGLTAAWGIVRSHGGEIEIDSSKGVGTTVRVRLPRAGTPASTSSFVGLS
jgi:signal transduction histidine kinase